MKLNNKIIHLSFGLLFLSTSLAAQDLRPLSLDEAIELGMQNSNHLKIDSAKVVEARAAIDEARNRQLPDLKLSGTYMRLTNANVNLKNGNSGSGENAESSGEGMPSINQAAYAMANFSLPLFAGGRIRYGIESSKYLLEAEKLSADNDKNAIAYNISQAYVNLFKAARLVDVIKENLEASKKRDQDLLNMENNGLIARNDRLKAQLQTSDIELQLLEAVNNFNIATVNMDLLLGLPEATQLQLDSSFIQQTEPQRSFSDFQELAEQSRKDLQALDFRQKAAGLQTRIAKAERWPTLALTGGYVAVDVPKFLTVTNAVNAGIGIQYNLANLWKTNAVLKQSKAREVQLTATHDQLSDEVRLALNRDYQNAFVAGKKIEVYQNAELQAKENYRITKNKFDNSLVTVTELLDANVALLMTKINVLNAKADAALAHKKLLMTTGILYQ